MKDRIAFKAASILMIGFAGCAEAHDAQQAPLAVQSAALIGGIPANSPTLDAIGTIGVTQSYSDCYSGERVEQRRVVCSASLISERVVLTAKHCVEALLGSGSDSKPYFAMGPDSDNPVRVIDIVDKKRSPVDTGGFNFLGRDVAVVYLATPVTDVKPLRVAALPDNAIGERFGAIGYGLQDNSFTSGTRTAGSVTLNAVEGRVYELIFGSYEAYRDWYMNVNRPGFFEPDVDPVVSRDAGTRPGPLDAGVQPGPTADGAVLPPPTLDAGVPPSEGESRPDGGVPDWLEQSIRDEYENTLLLPGYEAYVGNRPGDAQLCHGDSGSPLVREINGELVAYGVVSGGIFSNELVCDYGAVYATFGPETLTFLSAASVWIDACDGASVQGSCAGTNATRCTSFDEGVRRITVTDCSLLGQTCAVASDGSAVCAAAGEVPVVLPEVDYCDDFPGFPGVVIEGPSAVGARPSEDSLALAAASE